MFIQSLETIMNNRNLVFRNNPIEHIAQQAIDNISWFITEQANSNNPQRCWN